MAERFGRYEVRGELGRGGMATVYRAWDPRFHREVAIKVLSHRFSDDPSFRVRFEREARAIATLEHHAIVPVHDFGEEGGDLYLVMRLLTGGSLADRIAGAPVSLEALVPVVQRIGEALDYAHERGIVHRDVKPANIMFDASGNAFLADFGIARMAEQTGSLTGIGVVGSPSYMSPEQAEGKPATAASDIYSLGATVYEALAGHPPFRGESPLAVLLQHIRDEPEPIASAPTAIDGLIGQAMAKAPSLRFESGAALARALATLVPRSEPERGHPLPQSPIQFSHADTRPLFPPRPAITVEKPQTSLANHGFDGRPSEPGQAHRMRRRRYRILGGVVAGFALSGAIGGSMLLLGSMDNAGSANFVQVAAGQFHTCGVKTDGSVACWGDDDYGQASPPSGDFVSVSAATFHTCGVKTNGSVACWGDGEYGRTISPSGTFVSVSAATRHTCGVKTNGNVACWGDDEYRQASPPSGDFVSVGSGHRHSCGLKKDGGVACWGDDEYGQASPPSGTFVSVSAGAWHTCGVKAGGSVACWGNRAKEIPSPP